MRVQEHHRPGLLVLKVAEKTLVKHPQWDDVMASRRPDTVLVVLDLEEADFISSLFLQGCVELSRALAAAGQQLALLHLSAHQEGLLDLVEGASRLSVLKDEAQVNRRLESLLPRPGRQAPDEGVTRTEKSMLWD